MKFKDLEEAVERNIRKLFTSFYKNPAIFWTEADVKCYLYALLINDPFFKNSCPNFKDKNLRKESNTFLVHTELPVTVRGKDKKYDILIMEPSKTISYSDCESTICVEIKFNRRDPARKEKSSIVDDVKKAKEVNRRGYVLWLNWACPIRDNHLKRVRNLIKNYKNVELFYLDLYSEPIKASENLKMKNAVR
jgi:hypothetical protein